MLLDHANCELKAASTALGFLYRYPDRTALAQRMSRLAREELRHFEQVRSIMDDLEIPFQRLSASRYAGGLRDAVRQHEPYKLLDHVADRRADRGTLLRAISRKSRLGCPSGSAGSTAACWPPKRKPLRALHRLCEIGVRYRRGAKSMRASPNSRQSKRKLISDPDDEFRFHSGRPATN